MRHIIAHQNEKAEVTTFYFREKGIPIHKDRFESVNIPFESFFLFVLASTPHVSD